MALSPERKPPFLILTPWRYERPWARFMGCAALILITIDVLALVIGDSLDFIWYPSLIVIPVLVIVDQVKNFRDHRRFKRTMKTLRLWGKVVEGKVKLEDLTPAQQEDIAVQRATIYTSRPAGEDHR